MKISLFSISVPNIFIGMDFGKAMVPWWLTWILCFFFLFSLICEVILEVHQCCTHKKNKGMQSHNSTNHPLRCVAHWLE